MADNTAPRTAAVRDARASRRFSVLSHFSIRTQQTSTSSSTRARRRDRVRARFRKFYVKIKNLRDELRCDNTDIRSYSSCSTEPTARAQELRVAIAALQKKIRSYSHYVGAVNRKSNEDELKRRAKFTKWYDKSNIATTEMDHAGVEERATWESIAHRCRDKAHAYGCQHCWEKRPEIAFSLGERNLAVATLKAMKEELDALIHELMQEDPQCSHSLWARGEPYAEYSSEESFEHAFEIGLPDREEEIDLTSIENLRRFTERVQQDRDSDKDSRTSSQRRVDKQLYC